MITVTYDNGTLQTKDFESREAFNEWYERINPFDNPFVCEIIEVKECNPEYLAVKKTVEGLDNKCAKLLSELLSMDENDAPAFQQRGKAMELENYRHLLEKKRGKLRGIPEYL